MVWPAGSIYQLRHEQEILQCLRALKNAGPTLYIQIVNPLITQTLPYESTWSLCTPNSLLFCILKAPRFEGQGPKATCPPPPPPPNSYVKAIQPKNPDVVHRMCFCYGAVEFCIHC